MNKKLFVSKIFAGVASAYFNKRLKNPVFIIGSGRSGTTLLATLLKAHQSVICFPNEANDLWHPALYPFHKSNIDVPPIWLQPYEFTSRSLELWPGKWGVKIRALFGAYQVLNTKPVFLIKSVMINFMLDKIVQIFPDAKIIYIVRNGLSVALSYQKKEVEKYKLQQYSKYSNIINDVKQIRLKHAAYWNETIEKIEKDKNRLFNKDNFFELKYESLVASPDEEIEGILQFLNLPMGKTKKFKEILGTIDDRNYKAIEELDAAERWQLKKIMQHGLHLKKYN